MRYKITLSYDGTGLCGWQKQPNGTSIQGELDRALEMLLGAGTATTGAGRTDSNVNAVRYIAHFDAPEGLAGFSAEKLCYKLNAILPKKIVVHGIESASDDFHARFDATRRDYRYYIHRKKNPFTEQFSYRCPYPLDLKKMNEAAKMLLGTHDFSCFEKTGGNNKTSTCTVMEAGWDCWTPALLEQTGYPAEPEDFLVFHVSADRFLRNMVRAIVGTLIDIGRGKHEPEWISELLESGNRSESGESVPGHALFFCGAHYD